MFTVSVLSPNCEVLIIMENSDGGYRVFSCDPGLKEVYWWLGVPLALFVFVVTVYAVAPNICVPVALKPRNSKRQMQKEH
jgi:hypothetical protein